MEQLEHFAAQWHSPEPYIEAHTSGSTGKPKTVRLLKSDMRASARATNAFFGITARSLLACPLSVDYIAGKMMVVRAFEAACRFVQLPVSSNIEIPDNCGPISLLPVVPTQIASLTAQPHLAGRVSNVLIGGAAPSEAQCKALVDAGYNAWISYGMTETCSHIALARADDKDRIYRAMPGVSFSTDDKGCLAITAPHYSFGTLHTTDIVELVSAHSFRWLGRADNVINSGGIKMFAEELERLYSPALEGRTYYVRGEDDAKWGQAVTLVIEADSSECAAIAEAIAAVVADPKRRPKKIVAVAAVPRTSNGKICRR